MLMATLTNINYTVLLISRSPTVVQAWLQCGSF